ncbi:MAG: MerR family transcriptional regulator [Chloroflexi bacterium]|nr:MerR family transcriptional regulator [Chloroflexota bacterium]
MQDGHTISNEPCYVISIAARLVDVHPQTLRNYERLGLINPARSDGNLRLYSERDLQRLRQIVHLTGDLGVNLAGVELILQLQSQLDKLRQDFEKHGLDGQNLEQKEIAIPI